MSRVVNVEVYDACIEYIRRHYKIEDFLLEKKLWSGIRTGGKDEYITCPLHPDEVPSLSIDFNKQIYKCFSCGSKGKLPNLIADYRTYREGKKTTAGDVVDEFLKDDIQMRLAIGHKTVFAQAEIDIKSDDFVKVRRMPDITDEIKIPKTFLELSRKMQKNGKDTEEDIVNAILAVQNGDSVEDVYSHVFGCYTGENTVNDEDSRYNLLFGHGAEVDTEKIKEMLEELL